MNSIHSFAAHPVGALLALTIAAFLEVYGDSFFQVDMHRSVGRMRVLAFVEGTAVLMA